MSTQPIGTASRDKRCRKRYATYPVRGMLVNIEEAEQMAKIASKVLREIVRRIVAVAQPERIILFGSAARGEMGPHSDVDLLVVKQGEFDQGQLVGDIYMNLHGVGQAVDLIVVTPEQVERYRNTHCLVIAPALRQGKEIYRAGTLSA